MKRALLLTGAGIALFWQVLSAQSTAVWRPFNTQGMGFVDGLLVHPFSGETYIRTDVGGVFKWYGAFWGNLTDGINLTRNRTIANVESFALNYNTSQDTQVIYAVSGNGLPSYLIKSENNGVSWANMGGWPGGTVEVRGNSQWKHVGERLAIDPNDANLMYYGSRKNGLWRSNDEGLAWARVDTFPVIGGAGGLLVPGGLSFVLFDPTELEEIKEQLVSKNIYVGVIGGGVWRSSDGGQSFCHLSGGPDTSYYMPARAVFSGGKLIVAYEAAANLADGAIWAYAPGDSCSIGAWTDKTPGLPNIMDCPVYSTFPYSAVNVHPSNPDVVAAVAKGLTPRKIFITENFNADNPEWKLITDEPAEVFQSCLSDYRPSTIQVPAWGYGLSHPYEEVGGLAFSPLDSSTILLATGHGMYRVENYAAESVNVVAVGYMQGLEELRVNQMIVTPNQDGNHFFTAVAEMLGFGYANTDNVPEEKIIRDWEGNGLSLAFCNKNPTTIAIVGSDPGSPATNRKCLISHDASLNWSDFWSRPAVCEDAPWGGNIAISGTDSLNMVWVPEFRTFLGGCLDGPVINHPRYTMDGGQTWGFCDSIRFTNGNFPFTLSSTSRIGKFLESDKVNGSRFYYYAVPVDTAFRAQIWSSANGGATWAKMCQGCLPATNSGQLKANPYREGDLWFAPYSENPLETDTSGSEGKLWHSMDGGVSWDTIPGIDTVYHFGLGMPMDASANATLFVHGVLNQTEGIYYSADNGATFTDITGFINYPLGLITNLEGDLRQEGRVYMSTWGRGVFYGDVQFEPLRVEFSEPLRAVGVDKTAQLTWATASEINHDRFEVERVGMTENRLVGNFEPIGAVPSHGNSLELNQYYFTDHEPAVGTNCYRLRSLDLDGSFEYSNVACVRFDQPGTMRVFPNPSRGSLKIVIDQPNGPVAVALNDITGRLLMSKNTGLDGRLTLDLSHLQNGVYLLRANEVTERVVLAK
ncbi:MAG: T9SS type A sorting domain-containing protein [Saprospiraceae bacterium]